jgi:methylenetetrahydrofolate dehydrogenase (NADP+)/methenyltetrahydrofolate cyclohydrolase
MKEKLINGKEIAKKLKDQISAQVADFVEKYKIKPKLAIITVGEDPSIDTYIRSKERTCLKMGIDTSLDRLPETASLVDVKKTIERLNNDETVNGIILEMPLPQHIPFDEAVSSIDPMKDVDGLHPVNIGHLFFGDPVFIPNTPKAVMTLISEYKIPLQGKNVTMVGRSLTVGKPLTALLLSKDATVTVCHSRTKNLMEHTLNADVLVVSVGKPQVIKGDMVKEGAYVIDVGINVTDAGLVGDVDFDSVCPKASMITPVPGGVGPLTVCMIIENTLLAAQIQIGKAISKKAAALKK